MKYLFLIFFPLTLTAQDSTIQSGIEAPLPSFSKKFTVEDVQASTDKNDPSTIKINIKGEAKNISFPIKLPFKAEATNPSNTNPLSQAEPSAALAIEDKDGGVYEVDDKGKTRKIGNKGSELPPAEYKEAARKMNVRLGRATTPKLMFKALASEPLAFDEWQENFKGKSIIEKEYQKIGDNYYVPIKLIPAGMTGKVQVDLNGINKDSIIFKTPNGSVYTLQENNILSIAGAKNGDGIELYAQNKFDSTIIYGKLNIYGYEIKNLKVNLVPVNSTATIEKEKLENELNKIYYPYGVSISLNVLNKIEDKSCDLNNDGKLNTGDGEFLSRYTDEMSALNYILKTRTDFDKEAIYLFVLDAATGSNTKGDMPIKSQFGYIFKPTSQVISHEIAHGFFQLKHTFDDGIALQKNTTTNLMDYNDGNKLYKFQWDLVHDRGLKLLSFLQDSAGRKYETDGHYGTVYLVARMLGMDDEKAKQLAVYTESPDHDINSKTGESNVSGTYMYAEGRVNDHALTGGLWIDEQNKTSKWIEQTDVNNLKEIGRLLHRLGDCYSHTKYEEGYDDNVLPENRIMYGQSDGESKQHYFWDFSKPDQIYLRPKLYLEYVNRLAFVLSEKFKLSKTNFQINVFEKMVKFAKDNQCSLIGIIDYETAKFNNQNEVYIYVLPETFFGEFIKNSLSSHLNYVENTIKYIKDDGQLIISEQRLKKQNYFFYNRIIQTIEIGTLLKFKIQN